PRTRTDRPYRTSPNEYCSARPNGTNALVAPDAQIAGYVPVLSLHSVVVMCGAETKGDAPPAAGELCEDDARQDPFRMPRAHRFSNQGDTADVAPPGTLPVGLGPVGSGGDGVFSTSSGISSSITGSR